MEHTSAKPRTAKVFTTGRSQAVRLPKEFRFQVSEVFIRRDETTGEVILSTKAPCQLTWAEFFEAVRGIPQKERDQLPERSVVVTESRNPVF